MRRHKAWRGGSNSAAELRPRHRAKNESDLHTKVTTQLSVCPSLCLSVCPSVRLSVCLSCWISGGRLVRVYRAFSVSGLLKNQYFLHFSYVGFLVGLWWVFGGSLVGLWWVRLQVP